MEYRIEVVFSSELNERQIGDFISVQRRVFTDVPMTEEYFQTKFLKNIYGDSIIVIAYDESGSPAAARALWRNDINGAKAYQPSDTAVCSEHRRRGLFVTMTKAAIEAAGSGALIYNFPNGNSYPQYKKLGWKDYAIQYARIFTPGKYLREDGSVIDSDYLKWWIVPRSGDNYGYTVVRGKYYLVRRLNDRGRYIVFGRINESDAALYPKVKPKLMIYHSNKRPFYSKKEKVGCKIVSLNASEATKIPGWKTDVL